MLPLLPLLHSDCASSSFALGSDWDVEDEIAKELRELGHSYTHESIDSEDPALQPQTTAEAHVAVEALFAALSSGERYADKLAATINELHSLPEQHGTTTQAPQTASACEVRAAVAALQQCTGAAQPAVDGLQDPQVAAVCYQSALVAAAPQQSLPPAAAAAAQLQGCLSAAPVILPCVQSMQPNTDDMRAQHFDAVMQQQRCQKELATAAPSAKEQPQQECVSPGHQQMQAESAHTGASKDQVQPASPGLPDNVPPRSQLSPSHTPNTEDKRQHAATALLHQQPQPQLQHQQQVSQTLFCISPKLSTLGETAEPLPEVSTQTHVRSQPASAAAAAIAEEQQAAAEAAKQRQPEQAQLQLLLQQQVRDLGHMNKHYNGVADVVCASKLPSFHQYCSALQASNPPNSIVVPVFLLVMQAVSAAARQAAQAAARQQLQQQAEAAAVSYMAAWRIARAWQSYRSSPAHAQKLTAAAVLQAAVRGAAARKLLQQMQTRQRVLALLEAAVASGQWEALTQAAEEAAAAGALA
jgi:hypothetical protein